MKLPIGISDFKKLIEENYYYVDKTLFIKEFIEAAGETILIPRPRRFGKTINISMLRYFFENSKESNAHLFVNTEIWKKEEYQKYQGKYPVIFLTFKEVKSDSWQDAYEKIVILISREFERHFEVIKNVLSQTELKQYDEIQNKSANLAMYEESLFFLSSLLYRQYKSKVIILIDEYDSPIHSGYNNNFYDKVISFMCNFLSAAFKDNSNLARGVLTGILRTAREGIFSGLNNLVVSSILDNKFQDKFGFTQKEVETILEDQNILDKKEDIQSWYNGYTFGNTIIYNPWSIIAYSDLRTLKPYWSNTSDNKIIRKLIALSDESIKEKLELLFKHEKITERVDEGIIFPEMEKNDLAVWSLFLFSGYLTSVKTEIIEGLTYCTLSIPNKEIYILLKTLVSDIFNYVLSPNKANKLLKAIITGNRTEFSRYLQEFIFNSTSYYDFDADDPEKSYHLFVLGILVMLSDTHIVKSNRESGYGRYDIMIIPRNNKNLGIVIEFKKVLTDEKETLEIAAQKALAQIKRENYAQELRSFNVEKITALGIAFERRKILVVSENL